MKHVLLLRLTEEDSANIQGITLTPSWNFVFSLENFQLCKTAREKGSAQEEKKGLWRFHVHERKKPMSAYLNMLYILYIILYYYNKRV